jgi:RimJ/RimL family protein N-acetyltransferase
MSIITESSRPVAPAKIVYQDLYELRPVSITDIPQIELALKNSLTELQVYMAWAHATKNQEQFFRRVITQWWNYFTGEEYEMALFDSKTGEFLAYTGFYPSIRINPRSFEIGYWTASAHRGKGYATLATKMQIALIFEHFKGDRIEITCNLENQASMRVIEKCGFQFEGHLRNFYPAGTEKMFGNGYTKERTVSLFSLIPEDRDSLAWYASFLQGLTLYPVLDTPVGLTRS